MATQRQKQLHFVLIPLMIQGHLIPMVDIARLLAQSNVMVTIVTTPLNALRFDAIIYRDIQSGLPLHVVQLEFPHAQTGLPEGCESIDTLPSPKFITSFMKALSLLQHPFEQLFQELKPTPTCIVSDRDVLWAAESARKLKVPRISFDGACCFARLCSQNLQASKVYETVSETETFVVPGLPHRIELTRAQIFGVFSEDSNPHLEDIKEKIQEAEKEAYGVVVNSFEELEAEYVEGYKKVTKRKVWCIGPVSLCNMDNLEKAQRGNKY
ncbi:UDP-glycosyltransferase 73C10 [Ziziphus jujuba]|nr:UDP-glycosyltransferase 73C10 [Ziziphus jujuba]